MDYGSLINPREKSGDLVDVSAIVQSCPCCDTPLQTAVMDRDFVTKTVMRKDGVTPRMRGGKIWKDTNTERQHVDIMAWCPKCDDIIDDVMPIKIRCPRCYESFLDIGQIGNATAGPRCVCDESAYTDCKWAGWWMPADWMYALGETVTEIVENRERAERDEWYSLQDRVRDLAWDEIHVDDEDGSVWGISELVDAPVMLRPAPEPVLTADDLLQQLIDKRITTLRNSCDYLVNSAERNGDRHLINDVRDVLEGLLEVRPQ